MKDYTREEAIIDCVRLYIENYAYPLTDEQNIKSWFDSIDDRPARTSTKIISTYNITFEELESAYQMVKIYE